MCILFFFPVLLVSFGQRRLSYWLSLVLFVQKIRSLFSTREGLHHRRLDLGVLSVSRIQSSLVFWGLRDLILFGHTRLPCFSGHFVWVLQERVFILFPSFWSLSLLNSCLFFYLSLRIMHIISTFYTWMRSRQEHPTYKSISLFAQSNNSLFCRVEHLFLTMKTTERLVRSKTTTVVRMLCTMQTFKTDWRVQILRWLS